MDAIYIRDLCLPCVIGVNDWERRIRQTITLDIDLEVDLSRAGHTDNLASTVDYKALRDRIEHVVISSSYHLLEALAERIAQVCLEDERVRAVHLSVGKPGALRGAGTVGVRVSRKRA